MGSGLRTQRESKGAHTAGTNSDGGVLIDGGVGKAERPQQLSAHTTALQSREQLLAEPAQDSGSRAARA